jgi:hypothetical protein
LENLGLLRSPTGRLQLYGKVSGRLPVVSDEYLTTDNAGTYSGLSLVPAGFQTSPPWCGVLVATLVWSGRALDFFDMNHRRRSQLLAAAQDLGIESALQLTDSAKKRQAAHRRLARTATAKA